MFTLGLCIILNNYAYRIVDVKPNTYLLEQVVTVFEEDRAFTQLWKKQYIDKSAKPARTQHFKCQ
jgi:hypothetical protein